MVSVSSRLKVARQSIRRKLRVTDDKRALTKEGRRGSRVSVGDRRQSVGQLHTSLPCLCSFAEMSRLDHAMRKQGMLGRALVDVSTRQALARQN